MHDEPTAHYQEIITKASQLMAGYFQQPIHFSKVVQLSELDRRNVILRLLIDNPTTKMPQSLIVKITATDKKTFDAESANETEAEQLSRFARDWAGLEFLSQIGSDHAPHFYAGSLEHKFIVIEDLGHLHSSLVGPLTRSSSVINLQEAESALMSYMRRMGRMHADTFGKTDQFNVILNRIYPKSIRVHHLNEPDVAQVLSRFKDITGDESKELSEEVQTILELTQSSKDFKVLLHGDICPDNVFFQDKEIRLFDFEYGDLGHALIDGVYLRMSMPSCWCSKTIPQPILIKMEAIYREELKKHIKAASDDEIYSKALLYACAYWIIRDLNGELYSLIENEWICSSGPVPSDSQWKPEENSFRSRMLSRLDAFITCPKSAHYFPRLNETCHNFLAHLKKIWPQTKCLDHYPVFMENRVGKKIF